MPQFKFSDGAFLARAVEPLLSLANEGIINYTPDELSLVVSEPSGVLKAVLRIRPSVFNHFDCNVNSSARVNLEKFYKKLNLSIGEDALTIYGGIGDYIRFQYHNSSTGDSSCSVMKLTQIYYENMDINEFQYIYEAGVLINSEAFRDIIRHLRQFGSTVLMTLKKSQMTFQAEGEEITLTKWSKQCDIRATIADGDFLCSIFSLDYMRSLHSASFLSSYMWIHSSDTFNCVLSYPVAEGYFISFYFH